MQAAEREENRIFDSTTCQSGAKGPVSPLQQSIPRCSEQFSSLKSSVPYRQEREKQG
jgi:hypothetical protein